MSLLYGFIGVIFEYFYVNDWWGPETILGTKIGIEDFLLGFTNGGIASAGYLLFFEQIKSAEGRYARLLIPLSITSVLTVGLIYFFSIDSSISNSIGILLSLGYILKNRKDLFNISLGSGLGMLALSFLVYRVVLVFFPDWIQISWKLNNLSQYFILGIPVEDVIWYFLVGAFISVLYPYYENSYYQRIKNKNLF